MISLLTRTLTRLTSGTATPRRHRSTAAPDLDVLSRRIILPSMPITDEEMARAAYQDRGQKLARQEMWEELSTLITEADRSRAATPGGESGAMLLAFGARSDVVAVAEDALHDAMLPDPEGIYALEAMGRDHPDDYAITLIVALTHIDLGWAWRAIPEAARVAGPEGVDAHFARHFARAETLLAPYCGVTENAPSLAAAQCALLAAAAEPRKRVADDFEDLIDLDPGSPRHMRALGQNLLPARFGSYQQLEVEARRTAARTGDVWGAGAYTWVYFDALALDPGALDMLEPAFFIDGLRDILRRNPDQHTANLLAAFCAVTMAPEPQASRAQTATRAALHDCLSWILRDHLHELHPLIWTQALHSPGGAKPLPSRRALITEGRQTALRAIAAQFADEIGDGSSIAFSPAGMYRLPTL